MTIAVYLDVKHQIKQTNKQKPFCNIYNFSIIVNVWVVKLSDMECLQGLCDQGIKYEIVQPQKLMHGPYTCI